MDRLLGQGFNWLAVGWEELVYLAGVVVIAVLAGLVPAHEGVPHAGRDEPGGGVTVR